MAISYWMATGIHQKMENDITTAKAYRPHFKESFWTRNETAQENVPLQIDHLFPSFILLGFGLVPSLVVFFMELLYHIHDKRVANKNSGSNKKDDIITSTKKLEEIKMKVIS